MDRRVGTKQTRAAPPLSALQHVTGAIACNGRVQAGGPVCDNAGGLMQSWLESVGIALRLAGHTVPWRS